MPEAPQVPSHRRQHCLWIEYPVFSLLILSWGDRFRCSFILQQMKELNHLECVLHGGRTEQRHTTTCWTKLEPCLTQHCGEQHLQRRQTCVKGYLHILLPLPWGAAQRCCSIRGDKLRGTETGEASYPAHKAGSLQHSNPCTVSSGLASDQGNGVQWDLTAPHMEQTQEYFSHFIWIYIHDILILQVVKANIPK